jgi:hypothetical protein
MKSYMQCVWKLQAYYNSATFPFDKRYHFAEYSLAKSIFVQKNKSHLFIEGAQTILERPYTLTKPDKSLHIEIPLIYFFVS